MSEYRQCNDDAHIPEVRNYEFESWMSRSFSPTRLVGLTTDRLQDVECPDMDSVSERSQEDEKPIEKVADCEITLNESAYGEIAAILKEIEGEDIDFQGQF